MSFPLSSPAPLTPAEIVAELDRYIIGQNAAKKAVAVALRNRWRRQQVAPENRDDILPKNILMMGPTGVGKTEIARRLAQLARAPFIKVEATKFTEVGYVGRDVDSMIRDLVSAAVRLVESERMHEVLPKAQEYALDKLVDLLDEEPGGSWGRVSFNPFVTSYSEEGSEEPSEESQENYAEQREKRRAELREKIQSGEFDNQLVEIDTEEANSPFVQVFSNQGIEEMGIDALGGFGTRRVERQLTVGEARDRLVAEESKRLLDKAGVHLEAIKRTEQLGIIFIDEIDKVAGKSGGSGPDVSREGVQRDLLPVIEGSTVATKYGAVRTDHILFIAAGAFHISKPSDLIPELQGRLPIRVELESLEQADFRRILVEPKNSLIKQYQMLLETEGVTLEFTEEAIDEIAIVATALNEKIENIGARRLHTVLERLLEEVMFQAPDGPKQVLVDREMVEQKLGELLRQPSQQKLV